VQNRTWLQSEGAEVIRGIAAFYASRVSPQSKTALMESGYGILGAMGPDEFHPNVNNSAYVNAVAALSIRSAIEVSTQLGLPVPANWSAIAHGLHLPFDAKRGVHPEYDSYEHGTVVKQADTIMLGFPLSSWARSFGDLPALEPKPADLHEYAAHTTPTGPAMTWAIFSIGYLDAKNESEALHMFRRGYANVQPPFQVWTETPSGGCVNFITGAGGFLQSVISGYGGVRLDGLALRISPPEPPGNASSLTLRGLHYAGWRLQVLSTADGFSVRAASSGTDALLASVYGGEPKELKVGSPLRFDRPAEVALAVRKDTEPPVERAASADLSGVWTGSPAGVSI